MIIFLYGQDTYRLKNKLKEIINHYQKAHKSGLNLRYFEGNSFSFQGFLDEFRSVSMFGEKKLMVLKNIISNKDFREEFLKDGKKIIESENTILFCQEGEIKNDRFFNFLKKNGKSQEFKLLTGLHLKNWAKKAFDEQKADVDKEAIDRLADLIGSNLWQMSNEIKKIADYGSGRRIRTEDINLLVKPKIETDVFKTIDAIALRDKKRAFWLIHKHLEKGESHLYLLAMISFQFRNLLAIKSGSKLKMHPYVIKKTIRQAELFSLEDLKKIYRKIFQVDLDIKTGRKDPDTALDLFISGI